MVDINDLRESLTEEPEQTIGGEVGDVLRDFNTGLARTLGIPRAIMDVNEQLGGAIFGDIRIGEKEREDFKFPTGEQLQELGAGAGITFTPEEAEKRDTLIQRTTQNIGAAAPVLPFLPFTAPVIGTEILASFGAAGGGKFLEQTEFGRRHPELARGIGELGGGVGSVLAVTFGLFIKGGGSFGTILRFLKNILPGTDQRVSRRLDNLARDPDALLRSLEKAEGLPEGELLTTAQAAGSRELAALEEAVKETSPKIAATLEQQRNKAIAGLQNRFNKTGDIGDARALIEERLALRAEQAATALGKIDKVSDPTNLSTVAERILAKAEKEGRESINKLWTKLPKGSDVTGSNLNRVMEEELGAITEGGTINQISKTARDKLGTLKFNEELDEFELVGGVLFNPDKATAEAKAVHQFYSLLGFEKERLGRLGGQGNKIRIINKLRNAALDDLDAVTIRTTGGDVGTRYRDTIKLTREFHDKFTKGTVGRILGRARGETPSPVTALEDIIGQGGVEAKENIQQALRASPQIKKQIEDFLKFQFVTIAKNDVNNRINTTAGNAFIKKFGSILDDIFPELKRDFKNAITRQADVDEFIGVPQVTGLSPLAKEKTAAGFFLSKDPGEEMAALMGSKNIQRTNFLSDLVKITRTDPTGKALKGLQNGFTEELLKLGNVDDISKLSGTKMLRRLSELEKSTLKSGLFNKEEFNRLKVIADVFKRIQATVGVKALKGGVISDPLSKLPDTIAAFIGARAGGAAGAGIGSSLVLAGRASSQLRQFIEQFTNDGAKQILMKFVVDKELAKLLLTRVSKLTIPQREKLFKRVLSRLEQIGLGVAQRVKENIPRVPATGVAPAAGSFAAEVSGERDLEDEEVTRKLESLLR